MRGYNSLVVRGEGVSREATLLFLPNSVGCFPSGHAKENPLERGKSMLSARDANSQGKTLVARGDGVSDETTRVFSA